MAIDFYKLRPVGKNVTVERLPYKEFTDGGIAIPDNYGEKSLLCKLIAVGGGERLDDGTLVPATKAKPGDIVVIRQFEGKTTHSWEKNLLIVNGVHIDAIYSNVS